MAPEVRLEIIGLVKTTNFQVAKSIAEVLNNDILYSSAWFRVQSRDLLANISSLAKSSDQCRVLVKNTDPCSPVQVRLHF